MQQSQNNTSTNSAHRKVSGSTVHSRKKLGKSTIDSKSVDQRMMRRERTIQTDIRRQTAQNMKEAEIQKAIRNASAGNTCQKKKYRYKGRFGIKNTILALVCAAIAVFVIVYFVNLNTPDISLKVAAMQTGIEANYPNYVPRGYNLSNITSENGKITLSFKKTDVDDEEKSEFSIVEEKSSWDSNALYTNYVKVAFGEDYTMIKEQGLTIYVSDSNAVWVNGGIFYKIVASANTFTKKQIKAIATSL